MVLLWTDKEGDKGEPSPTSTLLREEQHRNGSSGGGTLERSFGKLKRGVKSPKKQEERSKQGGPSVEKHKGKTFCQLCKKKCSGEVLRVQDKYFHISCFKCKVCKGSLAQGGFFCKEGAYYCTTDYQQQFGTKCAVCCEYVEGEVVSALGNTYHQKCFTCARCRQPFPSGERVTYTGKEVLCQKCVQIPVIDSQSSQASPTGSAPECAGCKEELKEGQALIALDRQWHIWCFKCRTCDVVLHGEYMGKDGIPYCEKDYQKQFGVKCAYCSRYISGKVLQAGDNHHFHPTCARCTKCGDPFGDGEEMYLQGAAIWHPRCGPGPTENGTVLNGSLENGHGGTGDGHRSGGEESKDGGKEFDRMSSSASEMQFSTRSRTPSLNGSFYSPYNSLSRKYSGGYRTGSPGLILREYKGNQHYAGEDISRIYTYSYLTEEPTHGYLKRPIDPYDKPPTSPHFHRPPSTHSRSKSAGSSTAGSYYIPKSGSLKPGMKVLVESIQSETPRPRSPHMNNEEPIELAHFPAAKRPLPNEKPKIERDDFPAPPYPYTDPERRRRWSDTYKGVPISDDEDEVDAAVSEQTEDQKLKKEEEELSKIATGIGKVFLQNVREREKLRQWKMSHLDPRNASRTPSAAREPVNRLRYESPVNASPSRNMDHPRPWEEEEAMMAAERGSSYRSSVGRSVGTIPSYNEFDTVKINTRRKQDAYESLFINKLKNLYEYRLRPGTLLPPLQFNGSPPPPPTPLLPTFTFLPTDNGSNSRMQTNTLSSTAATDDESLAIELVISSLHSVPKPGYGLKSSTLPVAGRNGGPAGLAGDFSFTGLGDKTQSTEFSSGKSDISAGSISEVDRRGALPADLRCSTTYAGGLLRYASSCSPHLRRSLPNMAQHAITVSSEPPKIYPYHLLVTINYRLPVDVDRCNLERHLSEAEFEAVFHVSRLEFYRMPSWRRNDLKRRARLF